MPTDRPLGTAGAAAGAVADAAHDPRPAAVAAARRPTVCFFARVKDPEVLRRVEFYASDLRVLEELGYDVRVATRVRDLRPADVYFVWWWTWAFVPVALARLLRRPVVVTGVFDGWSFAARPALHRLLHKFALRGASANLFMSELERRDVPGLCVVTGARYSPYALDTEVYSPGDSPREDFVFTVAWMQGANAERKCMPELIRAIPEVCRAAPGVRFLIAGERGSYHSRLAELAESLGVADRVEFLGVVSRERKIELMRRCKVYLQPSRFEGFGVAILEAMGCGAAVVTSPVGAVPEVVGDAARLVDGTSPGAIAEAVVGLLGDDRARDDLGRRARDRAATVFPHERRRRDLAEVMAEVSPVCRQFAATRGGD